MKLILNQYIASLKERGELDALLPDLLSQMGLVVFSRPMRGTRQDGVDVAAIGSINGELEKVYLFSIKPGDLTRQSWDSTPQSIRPSLNEIKDSYIRNRLPLEYRDKPIVICICLGGDVQENVRPYIKGYIEENTCSNVTFEEWNGEKLATLILSHFLREELMPPELRGHLRKALAMLNEPETSYKYFSYLVKALSKKSDKRSESLTAIRQLNICLWILYVWARDMGNLEAAYLGAELALVHSWDVLKESLGKAGKVHEAIQESALGVFKTYSNICQAYLEKILPHAGKQHALSAAVNSMSDLDVNLRLFDLLGRVSIAGLWELHAAAFAELQGDNTGAQIAIHNASKYALSVKQLVGSNPTLLLPRKDDQTVDLTLALLLASRFEKERVGLLSWLTEMLERSLFAFETHGLYPTIFSGYQDLLYHPKKADDDYRKESTSGSLLYPTIALWASLFSNEALYLAVQKAKQEHFEHCNFQFWFPDETTEAHIYLDDDRHGAVLTDVDVSLDPMAFLAYLRNECAAADHFENLSANRYSFWPVLLVASRHFRIPIPLQFALLTPPNEPESATPLEPTV